MRHAGQVPFLYETALSLMESWAGGGLKRWRRALVRDARGRTLDLGCGTGRNFPLFRDACPVGLDPELASLRWARRRRRQVPLVRARAEALPFRDGAFDTVVCGLVLCSVQDPPRAVAEIHRVLRDDGELRCLEHVRGDGGWGRFQDAVQPLWTWLDGACRPNRSTERTVEAGGFRIADDRRAQGIMRLFRARKAQRGSPRE